MRQSRRSGPGQGPQLLLAALIGAVVAPALAAPPPGRMISSPRGTTLRGGQPKADRLNRSASPTGPTAYTVAPTKTEASKRSDSPLRVARALSHQPSGVPVGPPAGGESVLLSPRRGNPAYIPSPNLDTPHTPPGAKTHQGAPALVARKLDFESLAQRVEALNFGGKDSDPIDLPMQPPAAEFSMPTAEQVLAEAMALQAAKANNVKQTEVENLAKEKLLLAEETAQEAAKPVVHNLVEDDTHELGHELFMQTLVGSELTDCSFQLDDGSRLPAHRCILVTKGQAFREVLSAPAANGVVHVANTSLASLRAFVQFLYVGDVSEQAMHAASWHEVWHLAQLYEVSPLKEWLVAHIDASSVARSAEVAADSQEHKLLEACFAFAAESLPHMPEEGLKGVREGVALNLMVGHPSSVERFKFAERWCRANDKKCGAEEVLTLLKGVDVDRLTMSELVEVVRPSNLMTADMLLDFYEQRLKTDSWGDSSFDIVQTLRLYPGDSDEAREPVPSGVALFGDGRVVVCDTANAKVQMLSFDGRFIREYGPGSEFGQNHLVQPSSVAVGARGQVIVTDRATNSIQIFTESGCFLRSFGGMGDEEGQFRGPHSVTMHPLTGDMIVTDEFNHRVQVLDMRGNVKRVFGSEGDGNAEFRNPTGVAVSPDGNIIVADCGNARIQIFTAEGHFIRSFGCRGEGPARFRSINGICVAKNGDIVVCDPYSDSRRLQVFDSTGVYLQSIGSYEPELSAHSHGATDSDQSPAPHTVDVGRPRMIAINDKGTIYVTDVNENKISVLAFPDGTMASREQRSGSPGATPMGLTGGREAAGK